MTSKLTDPQGSATPSPHGPVVLLGDDRYLAEACHRLGLPAVVVYGPAQRDGKGLPPMPSSIRTLLVDDPRSMESVMAGLMRAGYADPAPIAVLTTVEFLCVNAALLAEHFGARTTTVESAVLFRDKYLQKKRVREAGIATAEATLIPNLNDLPDDLTFGEYGSVIKPVAGAATRVTAKVATTKDVRDFTRGLDATDVRTAFILEDFQPGDEWIADGIVADGEVRFYCLGRYADPCLTVVSQGLSLCMYRFDPDTDAEVYKKAEPVVLGAIRALGLDSGTFHMELFHDPESGQVTFSECAARRGGGFTQEEVLLKFGVDLAENTVRATLGLPLRLAATHWRNPDVVGTVFLNGPSGTVVAYPPDADVMRLDGVRYARSNVVIGSVVPANAASTLHRYCNVLLEAHNLDRFQAIAAEIQDWYGEKVAAIPSGAGESALRAWQRRIWPDREGVDLPFSLEPASERARSEHE